MVRFSKPGNRRATEYPSTMPGTYMPTITVASTGQFASLVFTLVVSSPPEPAGIKNMTRIISAVPHHNRASRV